MSQLVLESFLVVNNRFILKIVLILFSEPWTPLLTLAEGLPSLSIILNLMDGINCDGHAYSRSVQAVEPWL